MIFFENFKEGKKSINFFTEEKDLQVIVKIVDSYTNLTVYCEEMTVTKNYVYFFSHASNAKHRRYEIWNSDHTEILLKINCSLDDDGYDMSQVDKFGILKNFNYENFKDKDPGLPLYEIFLDKIYEKYFSVEEGDVVVDIGGNIGLFSYYSLCRGAKNVYCFEPSPLQCSTIRKNFVFSNLIINEAAVAPEEGEISFFVNPENSINSSLLYFENSEEIICQSINLENYMKMVGEDTIDYLKIDCEGGEYSILENFSEKFLQKVRKICIEYHHNHGEKISPMIEKLSKCGFQIEFERDSSQIKEPLGIFYAWKKS